MSNDNLEGLRNMIREVTGMSDEELNASSAKVMEPHYENGENLANGLVNLFRYSIHKAKEAGREFSRREHVETATVSIMREQISRGNLSFAADPNTFRTVIAACFIAYDLAILQGPLADPTHN